METRHDPFLDEVAEGLDVFFVHGAPKRVTDAKC